MGASRGAETGMLMSLLVLKKKRKEGMQWDTLGFTKTLWLSHRVFANPRASMSALQVITRVMSAYNCDADVGPNPNSISFHWHFRHQQARHQVARGDLTTLGGMQ